MLPDSPCDRPGWKTSGNRCYRLFENDFDYDNARAKCKQVGGELARIDNAEQNALATSLAGKHQVIIGLNDRTSEGQWKWQDGSVATYTNWTSGQPDNDRTDEDCVVINWFVTKQWNDVRCSKQWLVLCSADVQGKSCTKLRQHVVCLNFWCWRYKVLNALLAWLHVGCGFDSRRLLCAITM